MPVVSFLLAPHKKATTMATTQADSPTDDIKPALFEIPLHFQKVSQLLKTVEAERNLALWRTPNLKSQRHLVERSTTRRRHHSDRHSAHQHTLLPGIFETHTREEDWTPDLPVLGPSSAVCLASVLNNHEAADSLTGILLLATRTEEWTRERHRHWNVFGLSLESSVRVMLLLAGLARRHCVTLLGKSAELAQNKLDRLCRQEDPEPTEAMLAAQMGYCRVLRVMHLLALANLENQPDEWAALKSIGVDVRLVTEAPDQKLVFPEAHAHLEFVVVNPSLLIQGICRLHGRRSIVSYQLAHDLRTYVALLVAHTQRHQPPTQCKRIELIGSLAALDPDWDQVSAQQ